MKFGGVVLAIVGWLIPVIALNYTQALGARLFLALVGIAISLVGILGVLNSAHQKTAIWKQ